MDNLGVARCLLEAGASTEAMQTGTLNRALHLAAFQGSYSVLAILLQVSGFVLGTAIVLSCLSLRSAVCRVLNLHRDHRIFKVAPDAVISLRAYQPG